MKEKFKFDRIIESESESENSDESFKYSSCRSKEVDIF